MLLSYFYFRTIAWFIVLLWHGCENPLLDLLLVRMQANLKAILSALLGCILSCNCV